MKKSLIAIAALAAVGAASAQSSVTLYGLADVYFGQSKTTEVVPVDGMNKTVVKNTGFNSGGLQGSRIGVKGVEDLGNGLKAVFNYEMGFDAIDGHLTENGSSGVGFGRRAVVGVQGGFGSVLLGRDYTPLFNLLAASSVDGLSSFETVSGAIRTDRTNGIHYAGNFSGVGVQAFAGYNRTKTTDDMFGDSDAKYQGYGLGVSYANGPFMVGLAAQEFKNKANGVQTDKRSEAGVGASYDFGAAKLFANYVQLRAHGDAANDYAVAVGAPFAAAFDKVKSEEANIGVRVPFGAASVMAGYGHNRAKAYINGTQVGKAKGNDWVVGANYAFSKRTDVYARVGRSDDMKFKGTIEGGFDAGSSKSDNYAIGLRHKF